MTTDMTEEIRQARSRVSAAAHRGERLEDFSIDDLRWAFKGAEERLEELYRIAASVRENDPEEKARRERKASADRHRALIRETDAVLLEMEAAEQAERRKKAEAEARRRLGWDEA